VYDLRVIRLLFFLETHASYAFCDVPVFLRVYPLCSKHFCIALAHVTTNDLFFYFKLNRATVQNPLTGVLEHATYRVSKSAWLSDWECPAVEKVSRRISDLTGLSMETAEQLQVSEQF